MKENEKETQKSHIINKKQRHYENEKKQASFMFNVICHFLIYLHIMLPCA